MDRTHEPASGRSRSAPAFRVIPPVAIGVPWVLGWAVGAATDLGLGWDAAVPTGWVLLGLFAVWNGWCLLLFRRHRTGLLPGQTTSALLESGPYRLSRNPLYVGLLVLHAGLALVADAPLALALLPVAWAALHWGAVLPEERYLTATMGAPYTAYCRRVRRWL